MTMSPRIPAQVSSTFVGGIGAGNPRRSAAGSGAAPPPIGTLLADDAQGCGRAPHTCTARKHRAGCAARRSAADRPRLDAIRAAVGHPGRAGEHEAVACRRRRCTRAWRDRGHEPRPRACRGAADPGGAPFALVRAGRWGSASRPNRSLAFVWQAGQAWTQFVLAPRVQVARGDAVWLLVRGADPAGAGIRHPVHAWRFGPDWLVEVRR